MPRSKIPKVPSSFGAYQDMRRHQGPRARRGWRGLDKGCGGDLPALRVIEAPIFPTITAGIPSRPCSCGGKGDAFAPGDARALELRLAARRSNDLVAKGCLAPPQPLEIFDEDVDDVLLIMPRLAGRMRRDEDVRHVPQGRCGRERLLDGDNQCGAIDPAPLQACDQRRLVDAPPA